MRQRYLVGLLLGLLVACTPQGDGPRISDARMGSPAATTGAVYMTVGSYGTVDRLVRATTSVARAVELHETVIAQDGTASMRRVDNVELPRSGSLRLEPGGFHLMLLDVEPLEVGDTFTVDLVWESAGTTTIEVTVVNPADVINDEDHDNHG